LHDKETRMKMNRLTTWIGIAMVLGIVVGYACHALAPTPAAAKEIAGYFGILTDIFLRLIKMIIAPLVFATLVAGLANMGDSKTVGRIGAKALGWFIGASFCSLLIGLLFANLLQPGAALGVPLPESAAGLNLKTGALNLKDFITHVFPKNIFEAMAANEILQILVFSVFLGLAVGQLRHTKAAKLAESIEEVVPVMLKVTDYVMRFAPIGVFALIAGVVASHGIEVLLPLAGVIGVIYLASIAHMLLIYGGLIGGLARLSPLRFFRGIAPALAVAFSTSSSSGTLPVSIECARKNLGVSQGVAGFVLPVGATINMDGTAIYQGVLALFIAQAFGIDLNAGQYLMIILSATLASVGTAGVPGAGLIMLGLVLTSVGLPLEGVALIAGIDRILDMARTTVNVAGDLMTTTLVGSSEKELDREIYNSDNAA